MLCPFCAPDTLSGPMRINDTAFAFPDANPVTPGHTLIASHRHESDFFALSAEEREGMFALAAETRVALEQEFGPIAVNLGVNIGAAAGQTVPHAHLHLIPRSAGDVAEPRGGVRWVVPEKAVYWR